MKMGKNNTELLKIAEKYVGQGGSKFRKFCGLPANAAWCNAYVDTIAAEGGDSNLYFGGKKYVYVPDSLKWCRNNIADIPIYLAMPMDIIFFDWNGNGVPDHIGFVRSRNTDQKVNTIEGNTSGGIVAKKTRPVKYVLAVFRPEFPGTYKIAPLEIDGQFGYNSIAMLQTVLGIKVDAILGKETIKMLQKVAGVTQDGSWGTKTSKAVQKMIGTEPDGFFGKESVKALQKWINKQYGAEPAKPVEKPKSNAQKIADKANELAYKTASSKAKYPSGKPTEAFKKALNKVFPDRSKWGAAPKAGASCDVFVATVIRSAGIDKAFPRKLKEQWEHLKKSDKFVCVLKTTSKDMKVSSLKDGDIITYQYKDGTGHICILYGGKLKHAAINKWYGRTSSVGSRYKISDKKWIKVYRAK